MIDMAQSSYASSHNDNEAIVVSHVVFVVCIATLAYKVGSDIMLLFILENPNL